MSKIMNDTKAIPMVRVIKNYGFINDWLLRLSFILYFIVILALAVSFILTDFIIVITVWFTGETF